MPPPLHRRISLSTDRRRTAPLTDSRRDPLSAGTRRASLLGGCRAGVVVVVTSLSLAATSLLGAPAASAQFTQFLIPGSSFGFTSSDPGQTPLLDPIGDEYRHLLAEATNAARTEHDLAPVRLNADLSAVALAWSTVQAIQDEMAHNPAVGEQIPRGFSYWSENVLQNWRSASPQDLVNQWMASPAHRVNLLRADHTTMGMGVAVAADNKLYATQVFARY